MIELLNLENLGLYIIFIFPGFLSYKVWTLLHPTQHLKISEIFYEIICYSFVNFAFLLYFVDQLNNYELQVFLYFFYWIIILFIGPIIWPILLYKFLNTKWIKKRIVNITPNSWDYYFQIKDPCFVLIHLNNGKLIGGLYAMPSYASAYPESKDLYLREVWKIDKAGKFKNKIKDSKGLYISYDQISYIEFFKALLK